ncbi:MAG: TRAP transporter substrate-binding protein [Desulfovibrio sp.]|jgi:tripartite ATP-independent transporter DctP family solute receptor|nr:TRAP transporter substrate-binding protein [Desulfovibrio sp.]
MNLLKALSVMALVCLLAVPVHAAQQKIVIRYSHSSGAMVREPHHAAALDFKNYVEKAANGAVEVQVYPASQLGGEERNFQDIQNKVIQAASLAVNNATLFSPSLGFFDLPYIFNNFEEAYKAMDENWDEINKRMIRESGNMAVGWLVQGFRVLSNSRHQVKTLADLKGLKIRVPNNPIMIATFKAWGCEPAPMAWDETFNALQQKVVDGQENPYAVFASNKFEEVQKYITEIHYKMWIGPIVVNADWLEKLPPDIRKTVLEAGRQATKNNRAMIAEMDRDLKAAIAKAGVRIIDKPDDETEWSGRAMTVWPQFYDKIGDLTLLDNVMKSLGRTKP